VAELGKKLGFKPGDQACLLDAPPEGTALLRRECVEVEFDQRLGPVRYSVILFWPREVAGLTGRLAKLQRSIAPDGAIWVVIPKAEFARRRGVDLPWEAMQAAALQTDLVDNKVASITEEEYGTRFVIRKDRRAKYEQSDQSWSNA